MEGGINSIAELIAQQEVQWGTLNGSNAQILLEAANAPELIEVNRRMVCSWLFYTFLRINIVHGT